MKKISILFLLISSQCFAQKEGDIWYFGQQAGVDFNSGTPVALTNCSSSFNAFEGVGSRCDANGNLLFYTDGNNVINANQVPMPNGTGLFSNTSSTETGLIVKQPGYNSIYYIFHIDMSGQITLYYSTVDMTLNGGLGDVVQKNVLLRTNTTEKETALYNSNGTDVWIVTHDEGNNAFVAFLLTSSGLSLPVVSNIGPTMMAIGYLKSTPQGDKLGSADFWDGTYSLYDFDNSTGVVSNPSVSPANYMYSYGCEFSPDGSKFYGGQENSHDLWQFDVSAGANVWNTATLIYATASQEFEDMQLGPDGKIYTSRYQTAWLGVVNDPDSLGAACNYVDNGVNLLGHVCYLGLPNYNLNFFSQIKVEDVCYGDSTHLFFPSATGDSAVWWDFGDPPSGAANNDTGTNVHHVFTSTDTFHVTVIEYKTGGLTDTTDLNVVISNPPVINLGNDTILCIGDTLMLNAGNAGASYSWSNGSSSQTIAVTDSNTYYVTVNNSGCKNTDSVNVSFIDCSLIPQPGVGVPNPIICEKFCLDFTDQSTNNPTSWLWTFAGGNPSTSTLQNPTNICYNLPGTYDVTLTVGNGFGSLTHIFPNYITVYATPPFPTINQVGLTLYSSFATNYQWQLNSVDIFGATNQSYTVTQSGYYSVVVADVHGCTNYTTLYVLISGVDDLNGDANIFISPNPSGGDFTIQWMGGSLSGDATINVVSALGQIIYSSKEKISGVDWSKEINLGTIARGVYFIEIKTENVFARKKILVSE